MLIEERLQKIKLEIEESARRAARDPSDILLLAVSKRQPLELIVEAHKLGQLNFGENYVQEALEKIEKLEEKKILWHMIGPLQRKKIKKIRGLFSMIHTVDSLAVAETISKNSSESGLQQDILLQVNVSSEESKSGMSPEELPRLIDSCQQLSGIVIKGLMTMPPFSEDPESSRPYFRKLNDLVEKSQALVSGPHQIKELSMGTTQDFTVAIEEGATIVRLGTSVFGSRDS